MKKNLRILMLAPCLLAVLCDPDEDVCGLDDPEPFVVNVENISETYSTSETIWLDGETSAFVVNGCTETDEAELVLDESVFLDALFVLKLGNENQSLNATVSSSYNVSIQTGEAFTGNYCLDAIEYTPELSDDQNTYNYRLGITVTEPGDYCIVNARNSFFDFNDENNAQIFQEYNTLEDDKIKFENCDVTYTRDGTNGFYFFRITN
ncbi:MAG: hypothetical protein ACWA5P_05695 [bacterium]